jgi:two-component system OmpR family response regulator
MPQTVMVVDDDKDILELAQLVLEGGGYRVITAPSGAEALRTVTGIRPDLILLDINMPGMEWRRSSRPP